MHSPTVSIAAALLAKNGRQAENEVLNTPEGSHSPAPEAAAKRLWINGISQAQLRYAPDELRPRLIGVVHNAVDLNSLPLTVKKEEFFVTMGRFTRDKGQATAARIC